LEVAAGQSLIFAITGTEAGDFGDARLNIKLNKPGSSIATANFLDTTAGPSVSVSGNSQDYPTSYASSCNNATDDGPDVVSEQAQG